MSLKRKNLSSISMSKPFYNTSTPFLRTISDSISNGSRDWAIEWSLSEIERPIRKLRKRYPDYTTPSDCKRLGQLFLQGRVPKEQVAMAAEDLGNGANVIGLSDKAGKAFAQSIAEGVRVVITKRHVIRFVGYYLTALKIDGASDKAIEKEAERMTLSYKSNGKQ